MPTIKLPEESQHSEGVRKMDAMIRELSKAPAMTPSTRALGLRPSLLMVNHQELAHVMATRTLLNQQKRMIALAVAASLSAPYELVATIAHVTSINIFERAIAAFNDVAPMRAQDMSTPILIEVRQKLGSIPRYFTYMAADPKFAKIVLDREVATVLEGEVSRLNKELIAYATSVVNDARLSITYRAEVLRQLGMTNEQLFEATTAISVFAKNCAFSTGLQLEPTPA